MIRLIVFAGTLAVAPSAFAGDCSEEPSGAPRAICQAREGRTIDPCGSLGGHDDRLYCFAVGRVSPSACNQIMDDDRKQRCYAEVEALATGVAPAAEPEPTRSTTPTYRPPPPSAANASDRVSPMAYAGVRASSDCSSFSDPDMRTLCRARAAHDASICGEIHSHEPQLYCFGVLRPSANACHQVMNKELEAACLNEIGAR